MPREPWSSFPLHLIKIGKEYHTRWGESPDGKDVTGIPVFGDRLLAMQQIEADGIRGTIQAMSSPSALREFAGSAGDTWLFFFANEESEMLAVRASELAISRADAAAC